MQIGNIHIYKSEYVKFKCSSHLIKFLSILQSNGYKWGGGAEPLEASIVKLIVIKLKETLVQVEPDGKKLYYGHVELYEDNGHVEIYRAKTYIPQLKLKRRI